MRENHHHLFKSLFVLCVVLACAGGARAAEHDLTQLVPEDTLFYFGRAGSDQTSQHAAKTA